ncbi:LANO_0F03554g1_1 [Lachancea nothofagi CBS 11611]|uniref:LANO_0F03554g1_1 n=1 Tax=Lachancea nothofagi CBS 11611 TaxID=1266666 RepID=A0A1G4K787_9SACH|nr:LANO_0F03554g1_1 [Lachancea nothofagi CBS 11611]
MSLGISLSQLIVENPEPLFSGHEALDEALGGFQPRSIYEVFGPPGIGKIDFGIKLVENALVDQLATLWIDAHQTTRLDHLLGLKRTKLDKFSHYVYFFKELVEQSTEAIQANEYSLIVIRGLSKVVTDYLYECCQSQGTETAHQFKNKSLITLFTLMTKYAHRCKSTIVMLNDAMNTSFTTSSNSRNDPWATQFTSYTEESPFLVKSHKRKAVQVLRSALVANLGVGNKDQVWEVFIRRRIGFLWEWDGSRPWTRVPKKHKIAVIQDMANCTEVVVPLAEKHAPGDLHHALPLELGLAGSTHEQEHVSINPVETSLTESSLRDAKRPKRAASEENSQLPFTPRLTHLQNTHPDPNEQTQAVLYDSEG